METHDPYSDAPFNPHAKGLADFIRYVDLDVEPPEQRRLLFHGMLADPTLTLDDLAVIGPEYILHCFKHDSTQTKSHYSTEAQGWVQEAFECGELSRFQKRAWDNALAKGVFTDEAVVMDRQRRLLGDSSLRIIDSILASLGPHVSGKPPADNGF